MRNACVRAAGVLLAAVGCTSSLAAPGFYFGVEAGTTEYDISAGDFSYIPNLVLPGPVWSSGGFVPSYPLPPSYPVYGVAVPTSPFAFLSSTSFVENMDRTDTGFRVSVGYEFNRNVSAELAYFDAGSVSYDLRIPVFSGYPPSQVSSFIRSTDIEITGLSLSVAGQWPLNDRWALFATVGYDFADAEVETSIGNGGSFSQTYGDRNSSLGAGVTYALNGSWKLRARFNRHFSIGGDAFRDTPMIDTLSLGVVFAPGN